MPVWLPIEKEMLAFALRHHHRLELHTMADTKLPYYHSENGDLAFKHWLS
jgi:hypothetical protein